MSGKANLARTVLTAFGSAKLSCNGGNGAAGCASGLLHHCAADAPETETAFEMICPPIRFGPGVTKEIGASLVDMRCGRALVLTDGDVRSTAGFAQVADSLTRAKLDFDVFDSVRVEPTDGSFIEAIEAGRAKDYDAFVAVGGGSAMDTAKCAALFHANPQAELWDYTTPPFGRGRTVEHRMTPLIAVPTTAGTGSETTAVAVFDIDELNVKSAIRDRKIKPHLALVDPLNVAELPRNVAVFSGFDVLCHALESYTAKPFDQRDATPGGPAARPLYQGSNPISDVWAEQALRIMHKYFKRAVDDHGDMEARTNMLLAASFAGMGFGNAGVHLCHGLSYPISGLGKKYTSPNYPQDKALIPHGLSVVLTAASVFEFTGPACGDRHARAAGLLSGDELGASTRHLAAVDAGRAVADRVKEFMSHFAVPNGLAQVGFTSADTAALAERGVKSMSALQLSPRPAVYEALHEIYQNSLSVY